MFPNTMSNMILGFGVIVGFLLLYVLSLVVRFRRAKINRGISDKTS